MAEIVNLRRARKAKTRDERVKEAAENRVTFGRPKADKTRDAAERDLAERRIDGHRLGGKPEA